VLQRSEFIVWVILALWVLLALTVVGFRLLCTVGRCYCLLTPAETDTAHVHIRFAVGFELSGFISLLAAVGLSFTVPAIPLAVPLSGFAFSGLAFALARVWFLVYVQALSRYLQETLLTEGATASLRLAVVTGACVVVGGSLLIGGSAFGIGNPTIGFISTIGGVLIFLAFGFMLFLAATHLPLISNLRDALRLAQPADEEADAAYREPDSSDGQSDE
jgi:hypothetical protein